MNAITPEDIEFFNEALKIGGEEGVLLLGKLMVYWGEQLLGTQTLVMQNGLTAEQATKLVELSIVVFGKKFGELNNKRLARHQANKDFNQT